MKEAIACIGLGSMGGPMSLNLIKAGYRVAAYDRNAEMVDRLKNAGAQAAASIGQAVGAADVIITILPKDENVLDAYLSSGGIIDSARQNAICIEMTSARGETIQTVAQTAMKRGKALRFLDAPVSGGVAGAEQAALTIMCGGDPGLFSGCRPLLEAMGKKIFYTGALGSGKAMKMVNQLLNAGNTLVAAEAVFLAGRLGLDMKLFMDIVQESSGNSWVFSNNIAKYMLPRSYDGGFRLELLKKDIALSMAQIKADEFSLPLSELVYQIYSAAEEKGHGKQNYNVIYEWIESQAIAQAKE